MYQGGYRQRLFLLKLWVQRELRTRYAGTAGGLAWAVLSPLLTIAIYYLVFAVVLKVRIPQMASAGGFFFYLLSGLLPWLAVNEGLTKAANSLLAHESFLRRHGFPVEILPATAVIAGLVPQLAGTLILFALLLVNGGPNGPWWLLPFLLVGQLLLTGGLGAVLSVFALHLKDTTQVLPSLLRLLFYCSPILYSKSLVPQDYHWLFLLNPFACLAQMYHSVVLGFEVTGAEVAGFLLWTLVLGGGGLYLFSRLQDNLGEAD
jgi:lipopolysaccharide transport system permease protein